MSGHAPGQGDQGENDLVLGTPQDWATRSHRDLHAAVHTDNDPGSTGELAAEWALFGGELDESARVLRQVLTTAETGWTGTAAEAARAALRLVAEWVERTGRTAAGIGARLDEQGRVMAATKARMPEPVEFEWSAVTAGFAANGVAGFQVFTADPRHLDAQARAAHEQAVAVMCEMERESQAIDAATPAFTSPFNPVTGQVEEPPPSVEESTAAAAWGGGGDPRLAGSNAVLVPAGAYEAPLSTTPSRVVAEAPSLSHVSGAPQQAVLRHSLADRVVLDHGPTRPSVGDSVSHSVSRMRTGYTSTSTSPSSGPRPGSPGRSRVPGGFTPESAPPPATPGPGPTATGGPTQGGAPASGGAPGRSGGPLGGSTAGTPMRPGLGTSAQPGAPMGRAGLPTAGISSLVGPEHAGTPGATPPGGAPGTRGGDDDERRSAAYVRSEDIFAVPGAELPPSVIGGVRADLVEDQP